MSIPNGGKRDPRVAAQMKREGVLSGAPDLFIPEPRNGRNGLFIEMKRIDGRANSDQLTVHQKLRERGYEVSVCKGADEAYGIFLAYMYGHTSMAQFPHAKRILARTGACQ